jgi:biotin transport system substrate-specific component
MMATSRAVQPAGISVSTTWPGYRAISAGIGVIAFAVMTALGAYVRIPLPWTPVPITLQTLFVSLAGATLGPVFGPASQGLYLAAGAAGMPLFAGGLGGLAYLLGGPTTGYLLGFVPATVCTGWLIRRRETPGILWILLSMAAGTLTVYACGVAWLAWSLNLSLAAALAQGLLPFLLGDAVKLCAAAGLVRGARRPTRRVLP